jgi:membrane-associated protease RseP (regulator of RpoE activity)
VAFTIGIIAFVVMLILVVLIHEAAHLGFAKLFGFKVDEYFVGFGKRLWSTRRGETEYGVKAIPAGGYVKIAGMDPFHPVPPTDPDFSRTYHEKPIWQRAIVIVAGPLTHFVVAFLFFAIALTFAGGLLPADSVTFGAVEATLDGQPSPASQAGIRIGDRVISVQAEGAAPLVEPSADAFADYVGAHASSLLTLELERDGNTVTVTTTPVLSEVTEDGETQVTPRIGVLLDSTVVDPVGFPESIVQGARMVGLSVRDVVTRFGAIFGPEGIGRMYDLIVTDAPREITDPTSAVGLASVSGQLAESGRIFQLLFAFGAINVFVGLLNLLPLPPFDGGHLAVLLIERIRRKRIDMRTLIPVTAIVLTFFVLFTSAAVLLDITKPLPTGP